jgi:hypothetical protein
MESRKSAHKYKDTTDDWNDDSSCTLTSLPVSDLEKFQRLIFIDSVKQNDNGFRDFYRPCVTLIIT